MIIINEMQYQQIVNFASASNSTSYCGASHNCTDFVLDSAKIAGVNIPRNQVQTFGVTDPNKLADYLEKK